MSKEENEDRTPVKMGRPTKFDDEKIRQLKAICRLKPTLVDCASFLDIHPRTIEKWIRDNHDCTFTEFRDKHMVHTRFMLIRTALKQAENGNTAMLIFCLKNICKWQDKLEVEEFDKEIKVIMSA